MTRCHTALLNLPQHAKVVTVRIFETGHTYKDTTLYLRLSTLRSIVSRLQLAAYRLALFFWRGGQLKNRSLLSFF